MFSFDKGKRPQSAQKFTPSVDEILHTDIAVKSTSSNNSVVIAAPSDGSSWRSTSYSAKSDEWQRSLESTFAVTGKDGTAHESHTNPKRSETVTTSGPCSRPDNVDQAICLDHRYDLHFHQVSENEAIKESPSNTTPETYIESMPRHAISQLPQPNLSACHDTFVSAIASRPDPQTSYSNRTAWNGWNKDLFASASMPWELSFDSPNVHLNSCGHNIHPTSIDSAVPL